MAFDADNHALLSATVAPEPVNLEEAIQRQTRLQLLVLASVSHVVGAIGVSNTTLIGVMERRHEIGVRRAVGAGRTAIVVQFLMEAAALGALGGLIGNVAGMVLSAGIATANGWPVVIPQWLPALGPGLGFLVGLLAGAYPAFRAASIQPIEALR